MGKQCAFACFSEITFDAKQSVCAQSCQAGNSHKRSTETAAIAAGGSLCQEFYFAQICWGEGGDTHESVCARVCVVCSCVCLCVCLMCSCWQVRLTTSLKPTTGPHQVCRANICVRVLATLLARNELGRPNSRHLGRSPYFVVWSGLEVVVRGCRQTQNKVSDPQTPIPAFDGSYLPTEVTGNFLPPLSLSQLNASRQDQMQKLHEGHSQSIGPATMCNSRPTVNTYWSTLQSAAALLRD